MSVLDLNRGKVIGQPEVTEGYFCLNVKCSCGHTTMMFGIPGAARPCSNPECDYLFGITGAPVLSPQGIMWAIGYKRAPKDLAK